MNNIKRRKEETADFKQQMVLTYNGKDRVVVDPKDADRLAYEMAKKRGNAPKTFLM